MGPSPRLRAGVRIPSGGAQHSQPVVEGLSVTRLHANGGGMCQLKQPWLRLLVFSPIFPPPPPNTWGTSSTVHTHSTDASVHCRRMTIDVLVLEGYSPSP